MADIGLIVLAGGKAQRMGGINKALQHWHGKPLIAWIWDALGTHAAATIISANRDAHVLAHYGDTVVPDLPAYCGLGPLAGVVSAAHALPENIDCIQVVPCDTPQLPWVVVDHLHATLMAQPHTDIASATSPSGWHPVVCQFRRRHLPRIEQALQQTGTHSVRSVILPYAHTCVSFDEDSWFRNFNTLADLHTPPSA